MNLSNIVDLQREYFFSGITKTKDFRIANLKKLKKLIEMFEDNILMALNKDLGKSNLEAYMTEIGFVYEEIDIAIDNLEERMKPIKEKTPITLMPATSYTLYEPLGVTLIISPWNYPFVLTLAPLVGAIAAGNTSILKLSTETSNTSELIKDILNSNFDEEYIYVVDTDEVSHVELLSYKYDHIFYTGGTKVGKVIMEAASKNLSKVTLELGGKSPTIVDKDANINLAARSIAWGKTVNAGQTCTAPDYILLHASVREKFLLKLKKSLIEFYGEDPLSSPDFGRIINKKHFDRLKGLIENQDVIYGGDYDEEELKIAPTIIDGVRFDNKIMNEEIFGPLIPILTYENLNNVLYEIKRRPKPLAFYLFSDNKRTIDKVMYNMEFGNGLVNDTLMQIANPYLEFGGVGESGQGGYHGYYGFQNFSNRKSIMQSGASFDLNVKYPPYGDGKYNIIKKLM